MRTTWRLAAVVCAVVACSAVVAQDRPKAPDKKTQAAFVEGMNDFGLRMYAQLAQKEGNIFFSPMSLHAALSMTYVGAQGETANEMATALALPAAKDAKPGDIAPLYKDLLKTLNNPGDFGDGVKAYDLSIANALWLNKRFNFVDGFEKTLTQNFEAQAATVDLSDKNAAAKMINDWVAKQTNDRIKDIVAPSALPDVTPLVLANAIYFKATWADKFQATHTKDGEFKLSGEKTAKVPMMHRETRCSYAETDDVQVLSMPYIGQQLSMVIVLPRKADGLKAVEKDLTAGQLTKWVESAETRPVRVTMPRFKITQEFAANDPLKALGMKQAFTEKANFKGMVADADLFIALVAHKAFVNVNENGTEAAAATVVMMSATAMPAPQEPKEFKADHPFLFVIRHNDTGAILFMGRLADPAKEKPEPAKDEKTGEDKATKGKAGEVGEQFGGAGSARGAIR